MAMQMNYTTISEATVQMRFEASDQPVEPDFWFEFQAPLDHLMIDEANPLRDPAKRHLATIQRAALHYLRDAISEEIQRLSALIR